MKKLLLIALLLLFFGGALFCFAVIVNGGFRFEKGYREHTINLNEDFSSLSVDLNITDLQILPATDGKCSLVLYEKEKKPHIVRVENDTLLIHSPEKNFFDHIFPLGSPRITLYLAKAEYDALIIDSNTGNITVDKSFLFESTKIDMDTGNIRYAASTTGSTEIETDTGYIEISGITTQSIKLTTDTGNIQLKDTAAGGTIEIETDTGRIQLKNAIAAGAVEIKTDTGNTVLEAITAKSLRVEGDTAKHTLKDLNVENGISLKNSTGNIQIRNAKADTLSVSVSTGDVNITDGIFAEALTARSSSGDYIFERVDAPLITVQTSSGDVEGSLLTGKIFEAKSNSGSEHVPESSAEGGKCKITTSSGDIHITIAN